VVENNQFAYSTPVNMQTASQDFAGKAAAYGFPGVKVDGTDAVAVYDAVEEAVTRARKGDGPTLIEAVTMRMHGHAEHDPADYVPREMFEEWRKKDPVELFERRLLDSGVLSDATAKETREKARQHAIDARRKALADPMPDGSTVEEGVYAD
jgi:pyruvate dehydrogenase E1 component alpha subunit